MELRHLRYYVALANELHFRRAAEDLHITQPALSLQIRLLEEEIGVELLRRTKREVRLTSAGAVFLERARQLLADADGAVLSAQRAQRGETGELALSFAPDLAYELLPFVIKTYLRRWPGVRLVLRESWSVEQVAALHSRHVHLAILHPPVDQRGLTIRTILRERFVAVLPTRHPLTKRHNVSLADLAAEPWLRLPRPTSPGVADPMRDIFRAGGFEPNVVEESAQISTLLGMVAAGIGVCVLPPGVRLMRFRGVAFRPLTRAPELETAVAWLADAEHPTIRPFVDILDEVVAARQTAIRTSLTATRSWPATAKPPRTTGNRSPKTRAAVSGPP